MSAIVGIYNFENERIDSYQDGVIMLEALSEYPADDVKFWFNDNVFLGCHTQWITQESVTEVLPYFNSEKRIGITADAIIDNRHELFEKLGIKKSLQHNVSDSQLILEAYDRWGEDSPKYLVGDFAFMIWDERKKHMFGARDFSGTRSLYYFLNKNTFRFSTSIKPLLSSKIVKHQINKQWIAEFLAIPGMNETIDSTITPYDSILQIEPSHTIKINHMGIITSKRYCKLDDIKKLKLRTNEDYVEAFNEVFGHAVKCRLRSYKNVGSQLSGGLDSGTVVSHASRTLRLEGKKLYTYSSIPSKEFKDWTPFHRIADESPYIDKTISYVGNISESYLSFEDRNAFKEIPEWLSILEMPYKFFENSHWIRGTFEHAKNHDVKVLLNGARGNFTISWGHALDYYASLIKSLKIIQFYYELNAYCHNMGVNKKRALTVIRNKIFPELSNTSDYQFLSLVNVHFLKEYNALDRISRFGMNPTIQSNLDTFQKRMNHFRETFTWNGNGISRTQLSLKYGVWDRDPTNDLRVIKFTLAVPENQYVQNGIDRSLIRRSTKDMLPEEVRFNQNSRGIQGVDWLYRIIPFWKIIIQELRNIKQDSTISEYINLNALTDMVNKYQNPPATNLAFNPDIRSLMRVLVLKRFLDKFE